MRKNRPKSALVESKRGLFNHYLTVPLLISLFHPHDGGVRL